MDNSQKKLRLAKGSSFVNDDYRRNNENGSLFARNSRKFDGGIFRLLFPVTEKKMHVVLKTITARTK